MIVQHWTPINMVSVKTLGITSVFQRHLNSEKRKALNLIILKSNVEDFNSCFDTYIVTFHPFKFCLTLLSTGTTLFITELNLGVDRHVEVLLRVDY